MQRFVKRKKGEKTMSEYTCKTNFVYVSVYNK